MLRVVPLSGNWEVRLDVHTSCRGNELKILLEKRLQAENVVMHDNSAWRSSAMRLVYGRRIIEDTWTISEAIPFTDAYVTLVARPTICEKYLQGLNPSDFSLLLNPSDGSKERRYSYDEEELLTGDRDCALALVKNCPTEFPALKGVFCNDKDVVLAAVCGNQWNLAFVSKALQDDIDVVLDAVLHPAHGGNDEESVLRYASAELKDIPELILLDVHATSVFQDVLDEVVLLDMGLLLCLAGCSLWVSTLCVRYCQARAADVAVFLWASMLIWWSLTMNDRPGHAGTKVVLVGYTFLGVPLYVFLTYRFANYMWKRAEVRKNLVANLSNKAKVKAGKPFVQIV